MTASDPLRGRNDPTAVHPATPIKVVRPGERLRKIAARMRGQDNRITAEPIFVVQQRRRIYGLDPDYTDDVCWCRSDDEFYEVTDPGELAEIEAEYAHTGLEPGNPWRKYIRTGYRDVWEWVQPFFSEIGAQAYIDANRHNLTDPRIYVESAHRNDEWQAVRAALLAEEGPCTR